MENPIDYHPLSIELDTRFSFTQLLHSDDRSYDAQITPSPNYYIYEHMISPLHNDLRLLLTYVIKGAGRDMHPVSIEEDLNILGSCPLVHSLSEDDIRCYLQVFQNCEQSTLLQLPQNIDQNLRVYMNHILKCRGFSEIHNFFDFNYEFIDQTYGTDMAMLIKAHLLNWQKTIDLVNKLSKILPPCKEMIPRLMPYDSSSSESSLSTDEEKFKLFEMNLKAETFISKDPNSDEDCKDWFFYQLSKYQVDCGQEDRERLCNSFEQFFIIRNDNLQKYCHLFGDDLGKEMYKDFQKFKRNYGRKSSLRNEGSKEIKKRKPRESRGLYLWQMILRLLEEPAAYSKYIRWTNKSSGEFEIIDSTHVSKLWGNTKNNPKMNYEKLSRSLRQYYNSNLMKKTNGKRLVYNFDMRNSHVQNFLNLCQKKLPPICPSDNEFHDCSNYSMMS